MVANFTLAFITFNNVSTNVYTVKTVDKIVENVDAVENFYEIVEIVENPFTRVTRARACTESLPSPTPKFL